MKYIILLGVLVIAVISFISCKMNKTTMVTDEDKQTNAKSIHSIQAEPLLSDEAVRLEKYKGDVMLVVNVASKCGMTPQYKDLQALHEELGDKGLSIIGFPSNDFMGQEPGSEEEIATFCQKNYGVEFDMYEKVNVKGEKHPVYQFLTEKEKNGVLDSSVSWNFQKYLLDKDGKLVAVFQPAVKVTSADVRDQIKALL